MRNSVLEATASVVAFSRSQMAILRRLCKYDPFNTVALRQTIAQRVIEAGKYMVA